jgi:hypothetical protein
MLLGKLLLWRLRTMLKAACRAGRALLDCRGDVVFCASAELHGGRAFVNRVARETPRRRFHFASRDAAVCHLPSGRASCPIPALDSGSSDPHTQLHSQGLCCSGVARSPPSSMSRAIARQFASLVSLAEQRLSSGTSLLVPQCSSAAQQWLRPAGASALQQTAWYSSTEQIRVSGVAGVDPVWPGCTVLAAAAASRCQALCATFRLPLSFLRPTGRLADSTPAPHFHEPAARRSTYTMRAPALWSISGSRRQRCSPARGGALQ